jgi:hypothetical protein
MTFLASAYASWHRAQAARTPAVMSRTKRRSQAAA